MGDITKTHILWQNSDAMLPSIASPVSSGEMVFTVSSEGMLTCFDTKLGKKVWEHDYGISCKASPTIVGSRLYLLDAEGVTHIIEASRTFKEEATAALGEKANATPAFIGDKIFIRGVQRLYCVGAK
jgi:outer membrane protein assembly factor BamB